MAVALRVEVAKLVSQWPLRVALTLCVVVPAGFAVISRAESSHPTDTLFGRWSGTTGFATSLTVLTWAAAWGTPLLAGLFAGDIFASEDRHGTWQTMLTRSITRPRLFAGKALAASMCVWFAFVVIGLVSLTAGLAAVGSSPLVGLSGQLIEPGRAADLVVAAWGLCLVWTTLFVALGLLLSIAGRSGIIGVLGPLVVAIVLQLLETIASGQIVRTVLPSTPSDAWHGLFTDPVHVEPIVQSVITTVIYTALFGTLAWWLLRRRAFAAADAVPAAARCTAMRIGMAVAAVTAVLAGLSGVGPTALTAARLNVSIARTFGNLTDIRYYWQTGRGGDPTIPWHAACDRGGVAGATGGIPTTSGSTNGKGAGDDWECVITDQRPSDGLGATTLDVTLKANGCYEAQSPPGAVGALYVNNQQGKPFLNPLFAFDGCFGTP